MEDIGSLKPEKALQKNVPSLWTKIIRNYEYLLLLIFSLASVIVQAFRYSMSFFVFLFLFVVLPIIICLFVITVKNRGLSLKYIIFLYAIPGCIYPLMVVFFFFFATLGGWIKDDGVMGWYLLMIVPASGAFSIVTMAAGLIIRLIVEFFSQLTSGKLSFGMRIATIVSLGLIFAMGLLVLTWMSGSGPDNSRIIKIWPTEERGILLKRYGPDIKYVKPPKGFTVTPLEIEEMYTPTKYAVVIYADETYYYIARLGASPKMAETYGTKLNGVTGEVIYPMKENRYSIRMKLRGYNKRNRETIRNEQIRQTERETREKS